ncbi:MAG TPA: cytochrome P450 [Solirubrobacteraceae bacterium]|jgi:cytochrome P450|nr:cytochrome P450 [Solirubrobacteraceae bacterium]
MALVGPPPMLNSNPLSVMLDDLRSERSGVPYPPGETRFSLARTRRFASEPLELLLESYERYGPIFTLRLFHSNVVWMLGPEANHHVLVSHANDFTWRDGHFRDLIGLMGDGLLTIDGDFHRRSRRIMLPVFHRDHVAASLDAIVSETERALDRVEVGAQLDVYAWTRRLAMRVAMRALFGVDPDGERARAIDAAGLFEEALAFYAADYFLRVLRMRGSPWWRMQQAARRLDRLIYDEIAERRASGARGEDILSLLLDAHDDEGNTLSDLQIRDEVMTLLFAGHDTTTSTVSFMLYELAREPRVAQRLVAEQDAKLAGARPTAAQLTTNELPELEMVLDETLRKYPPAWVGPRRARKSFEFAGHSVPARAFVNYSSWASHHLPDVFDAPDEFRPERFAPDAKAALPKGAYVPFGGGSRTCIGMRFGQLEVRTIATLLLSRFSLSLPDDFELEIRQMPTISPKDGLPVRVSARASSAAERTSAAAAA